MNSRLSYRNSFFTGFLGLLCLPAFALAYKGSTYESIKNAVFSAPYDVLPQYKVSKKLFGPSGHHANNHVFQAAKRTLTSKADWFDFPQGQKLFQANGICFAGEWLIDQPSAYTGQFSYPTRSLVVARASVALSGTKQANKRAFGMAIKLFPTTNPKEPVETLNAFVMHSLGGTVTKYLLALKLDNQPALGSLPPFTKLALSYRLLNDFKQADALISQTKADVGYRPVTHLAAFREQNTVTPTWLRLRVMPSLLLVDKDDFRDELRVEHYPQQQLTWLIDVASKEKNHKKSQVTWQTIGRLVFHESITSAACDQKLHFSHPRR